MIITLKQFFRDIAKLSFNIDLSIILWIKRNLHRRGLSYLMLLMTRLGNGGAIWLLLCAALVTTSTYRGLGIKLVVVLATTTLLVNLVFKPIFKRERPFNFKEDLELTIRKPYGSSFPSGHAASSFACACVLSEMAAYITGVAFLVAALISFSRIYLMVHYPSDVLGGTFIGVICSFTVLHIL